jgi:hypothetical protein
VILIMNNNDDDGTHPGYAQSHMSEVPRVKIHVNLEDGHPNGPTQHLVGTRLRRITATRLAKPRESAA